jgi:hypothetical protein
MACVCLAPIVHTLGTHVTHHTCDFTSHGMWRVPCPCALSLSLVARRTLVDIKTAHPERKQQCLCADRRLATPQPRTVLIPVPSPTSQPLRSTLHTPWPTPIDCTFTPSLHLSHALTSSKSLCGQNQATTERTSARARQRVGLAPPAHVRVCALSAGPGWSSTAVGDATRPSAGQPLGRWPRRAVSRTTAHLRHLIRPTSSALRAVL